MFKKVYVEVTNNCNLDCSFCNKNKRHKKFMSFDDFKVILSKLEGYTKYLYFHVMGEPLLHFEINNFIEEAYKRDFFINLTTNGYLIKRIIDNKKVRQVNVSLHSFDPKYNISLEEYIDNIVQVINKRKSDTIFQLRMWVNSPLKKDILALIEKKLEVSFESTGKLMDNVYFYEDREFIWPSLDNDYYSLEGSCLGTRDHIGILVDGTVVPCCLDSEGVLKLGNIFEDSVEDIVSSDLFIKIRQGFLDNKKVCELCRKCNFYELRKTKE